MYINIEELGQWLHSNNEKIVEITKKKLTLMDIVGISHLENQWSKIYQFFLTIPSKDYPDHGFGDIFIRSLEQILFDKGLKCKNGWLNDFEVLTEYPCESTLDDKTTYKRIDILLRNKQKAIIIENKVRHTLEGNDLKLYAKTILDEGCTDIKLIVLSLQDLEDEIIYKEKVRELEDLIRLGINLEYANVTHEDFMRKIEENLTLSNIKRSKYYDLYKEFNQNIMNQANVMTDDEYRFFRSNYEQVRKVSDLYKKIVKSYNNELKSIFRNSIDFTFKNLENEDNLFVQLGFMERNDVLLTIFFDRLWKNDNPYITIILELQGDAKRIIGNANPLQLKQLRETVNDERIKYYDDKGIDLKRDKFWMHYASWDAPVKNVRPKEFSKYLYQLINKDFSMYMLGKRLIDYLKTNQ